MKREIAGGVCAVGVPASIQNLLNVVSHMVLNNLAAPFGAAALAAMGIASKVCMMPMYASSGISQGVMPLIGYTYAARMSNRMKKAVSFTAKLSLSFLVAAALVCSLFSRAITSAFISDPETIAYGSVFIRGMVLAIPFLSMDFLAVGVFQAVGKGYLSLFMAILRKAVLEIPAYYLLNRLWPLTGLLPAVGRIRHGRRRRRFAAAFPPNPAAGETGTACGGPKLTASRQNRAPSFAQFQFILV